MFSYKHIFVIFGFGVLFNLTDSDSDNVIFLMKWIIRWVLWSLCFSLN